MNPHPAVRVIPVVFLLVSVGSFVVQTVAFTRIWGTRPARTAAQRGLVRTSVCRVGAAVLYVLLGAAALVTDPAVSGVAALVVFGVTQLVWQINAMFDVYLCHQVTRREDAEHED